MARKPSEKKLISFQHLKLIEGYTKDEAEILNLSVSAIIESHILKDILPENKDAQYWIKSLYSGEISIRDVIGGVYSCCSGMVEIREVDEKVKELVQYSLHQCIMGKFTVSGDEREFHHFIIQMEAIQEYFEHIASKTEDLLEYSRLVKEAETMQRFIEICKKEPQTFCPRNLYDLVIEDWKYLYKHGRTYRLLNDLTMMQLKYHNTAEDRIKLVAILKRVTAGWGNE